MEVKVKIGRNDLCPCGSGKKYKNCCAQWDEDFVFSQQLYEKEVLPFCNSKSFAPNSIVYYKVILPFQIPVDDFIFLKDDDYNEIFCCYFMDVDSASYDFPFSIDYIRVPKKVSKVFIFALTQTAYSKLIEKQNDYLTVYFDKLIYFLNSVILSATLCEKDYHTHYLTKEMLNYSCLACFVDIQTWKASWYPFILHDHWPIFEKEVKKKHHKDISFFTEVIYNDWNPFAKIEQLYYMSHNFYFKGFYRESVIILNTYVESMLKLIYKLCRVNQETQILLLDRKIDYNAKSKLIKRAIEEITQEEDRGKLTFYDLFTKRLQHLLGGPWKKDDKASPLGKWYNETYKLRNRAVHAGYLPTQDEAYFAIRSTIDFMSFVKQRIKVNKKKYPLLNELIH